MCRGITAARRCLGQVLEKRERRVGNLSNFTLPPASTVTIAPLAVSTGQIPVTFQRVPRNTLVTFTASLNGVSQARSFTIARTVDIVPSASDGYGIGKDL